MSIADVARKSGTSVATVSRVFNTPDIVLAETREKVLNAARDIGYLPNNAARSLRTRRSLVLGVILPTLTNPVFAECLQGIAAQAQQLGYAILPATTEYCQDRETAATERLLSADVEGLVLVVSNPASSQSLERIRQAGRPYVLAYNNSDQQPCVSVDNAAAIEQLVIRLADAGHTRIGMVASQLHTSDRAQQRAKGYRQGMAQCGLEPLPVWELPFTREGLEQLQSDLEGADRPTALVCSNDLLAIRTIRAASRAGLHVPDDISVVGFDGISLGADLTPSLASITQPNTEIGMHCVELLCRALRNNKSSLDAADSLQLQFGWQAGESCHFPHS